MQRGMGVKTTALALIVTFLGCAAARAQDPPVPPPAPVQPAAGTQAPVTPAPAGQSQATQPAASVAAPAPAARVELTNEEMRRRRNAIFLMEGLFVNSVRLAAADTQSQIETFQPGLRISMFSAVPPMARGNYLEDYGVFFLVQIPSYYPSVVKVIEDLARNPMARTVPVDPARPTALDRGFSRDAVMDPDAFYVNAVRQYLINAMLDQSKSLELRPHEWLTVSARGDDGAPGDPTPSVMMLRVKGADLIDFLAGRLSREDVIKRVEVKGFSGR